MRNSSDYGDRLLSSAAIIPTVEGIQIDVSKIPVLDIKTFSDRTHSILETLQEEFAEGVVDEPFWDVERKKDYLTTLTRILEIHEECYNRLMKGEKYPRELTEEWEKMVKKLARFE